DKDSGTMRLDSPDGISAGRAELTRPHRSATLVVHAEEGVEASRGDLTGECTLNFAGGVHVSVPDGHTMERIRTRGAKLVRPDLVSGLVILPDECVRASSADSTGQCPVRSTDHVDSSRPSGNRPSHVRPRRAELSAPQPVSVRAVFTQDHIEPAPRQLAPEHTR